MDVEDVDRIMKMLVEQEPKLFCEWIDRNYCVLCEIRACVKAGDRLVLSVGVVEVKGK